MKIMNENFIVLLCLLILVVIGGLFLRQNLTENRDDNISSSERSRKDKRSLRYNQRLLQAPPRSSEVGLKRYRRGFRSYFYNYLDELAMGICASIPAEGPGLNYAVRRTCGEHELLTCKQICTDSRLIQQSPKEVQKLSWTCAESLHVYKRQPALADNYEEYTDSNKLGLAVYRHNSCSVGKCGPNYCCCRAFATAV